MSQRHGLERVPDRGQAVVLVLGAVVLAVVCTVALARFGGTVTDRERAQAAADAAALAATDGGRTAAFTVALANGAVLVAFTVLDAEAGTVELTVALGTASATARATRAP